MSAEQSSEEMRKELDKLWESLKPHQQEIENLVLVMVDTGYGERNRLEKIQRVALTQVYLELKYRNKFEQETVK